MGTKEAQGVLLEDEALEKGFNEAVDDLKKSIGDDSKELRKAKKAPPEGSEEEEESDSEESDEDEEDEEEEENDEKKPPFKKSIEEVIAEDPEAAAAMDVEPYLRELAKGLDEVLSEIATAFSKRMGKIESMVKSQSRVILVQAELEKSIHGKIDAMGQTAQPTKGMRVLAKSRFGKEGREFSPVQVLAKSRDWLRKGKINLLESGMVETRVNKNLLGKIGDAFDAKVEALLGDKEVVE